MPVDPKRVPNFYGYPTDIVVYTNRRPSLGAWLAALPGALAMLPAFLACLPGYWRGRNSYLGQAEPLAKDAERGR